jgi:hypothetical protein
VTLEFRSYPERDSNRAAAGSPRSAQARKRAALPRAGGSRLLAAGVLAAAAVVRAD